MKQFEAANLLGENHGILAYLNARDLPEPVIGYINKLKGKFGVYDDFYRLKWDLEKIPDGSAREKYFKFLFLGIVYFLLLDERKSNVKYAVQYLNYTIRNTKKIIKDPDGVEIIYSALISLKYKLQKTGQDPFFGG